ncbi:UDP-N-acetylmuramate dehydrogenase [Patescibacteria group bacterium]|nr:UDP-N-acetylmuramate dehydrogenase [Patescibacteria group bacterium]
MNFEKNISLKEYSTFHIGGIAEYFAVCSNEKDLREVIRYASSENIEWRVIGSGSNILFADNFVSGLTIKNEIEGISHTVSKEGVILRAGAGVLLDECVAYACREGWWGLENLSAIPGTVGATPIQNVGAYGVEVADIIDSVFVYDAVQDAFIHLSAQECRFGYRDSLFKRENGRYVILAVSFRLSTHSSPRLHYKDLQQAYGDTDLAALTPQNIRDGVIKIREKKFPDWHVLGTLGSFFKNPIISRTSFETLQESYPDIVGHEVIGTATVKVSLGWILDRVCGLRGFREGNVGTYEAQALVVVNYGEATAHEVLLFAEKIANSVKEKTKIEIEKEIRFIK